MKKKVLYILSIVLVLVLSMGCERRADTEVDNYRKLAEQGDANAQCSLGLCYAKGEGVEKDFKEAVKWYRKSAEQGHVYARNNLGVCYDHGNGVIQDKVKAYAWFAVASANGAENAKTNINNLENEMTLAQIDEALKLAKKYLDGKFD